IIRLIPQELWGKLAPAGLAGCSYIVSRQSVLEQLPHGSVKVSFGELRRAAPAGSFVNTPAEDSRLIDLPLSEILAQLHPDSSAPHAHARVPRAQKAAFATAAHSRNTAGAISVSHPQALHGRPRASGSSPAQAGFAQDTSVAGPGSANPLPGELRHLLFLHRPRCRGGKRARSSPPRIGSTT